VPKVASAVATVVLGLVGAVRHLQERRPAGQALLVMAAHRFAFGLVVAQTVVLFRNFFFTPDEVDPALGALAVAGGCVAAGAALAVIVTPIVTRRVTKHTTMVAMLLVGALAVLPPALRLEPATVYAASVVLGLSTQSVKICVDSTVQEWTADDVRGRAFSLYDMLFNLALVTSAVTAAIVLPPDGVAPVALLGAGGVMVATALAFATVSPRGQPPLAAPATS
jgi:MFS family permease